MRLLLFFLFFCGFYNLNTYSFGCMKHYRRSLSHLMDFEKIQEVCVENVKLEEQYLNAILDEKSHVIKASGNENMRIGYFAALQMLESNKIEKLVIIKSKKICNDYVSLLKNNKNCNLVESGKVLFSDMLSVLWLSKPRCMILIEDASSMWCEMWIKDKRLLSYKKVLITKSDNDNDNDNDNELRWKISKREIIRPSFSTFSTFSTFGKG